MINQFYRLKKPGQFDIDFISEDLSDNQVIVRPTYLSICNSDLKYFYGKKDEKVLKERLPLCLIHEAVGEVVFDPKGKLKKGTQVVMIPLIEVVKKSSIKANYVPENRFSSSTAEGFTRSNVLINRERLMPIEKIDGKIAVFSEIMTIGINAIRTLIKYKKDFSNIAIWGDGNIGYTVAVLIKYYFPNCRLTVIGKSGTKLPYYPFADATYTTDELPKNIKFDCAFECVGGIQSVNSLAAILEHISPQGFISLIGLAEEKIAIDTRKILEKGIIVIGNNRADRSDFEEAKKILQTDKIVRSRIKILCSDIITVKSEKELTEAFDVDVNNEFKTIIKWEV